MRVHLRRSIAGGLDGRRHANPTGCHATGSEGAYAAFCPGPCVTYSVWSFEMQVAHLSAPRVPPGCGGTSVACWFGAHSGQQGEAAEHNKGWHWAQFASADKLELRLSKCLLWHVARTHAARHPPDCRAVTGFTHTPYPAAAVPLAALSVASGPVFPYCLHACAVVLL